MCYININLEKKAKFFSNRKMNKHIVICPYSGTPHSNNKEWITYTQKDNSAELFLNAKCEARHKIVLLYDSNFHRIQMQTGRK
jgi:hypothetical protein